MELHRNPFLTVWMAGFENGEGVWQAERSVQFLREKAGTGFLDFHDLSGDKGKRGSKLKHATLSTSTELSRSLAITRSRSSGAVVLVVVVAAVKVVVVVVVMVRPLLDHF